MLNPVLAAPTSWPLVFSAKITTNALLSLVAFLITILYTTFVLRMPFEIAHGGAFLFALAVFLVSASAFGLCLATLFMLMRAAFAFINIIETPLLILGGFAFPVYGLPWPVQLIGAFLPMRWSSEALRICFQAGSLPLLYWQTLGLAAVLGLIYYGIAYYMFVIIEHRVRISATLEVV